MKKLINNKKKKKKKSRNKIMMIMITKIKIISNKKIQIYRN